MQVIKTSFNNRSCLLSTHIENGSIRFRIKILQAIELILFDNVYKKVMAKL